MSPDPRAVPPSHPPGASLPEPTPQPFGQSSSKPTPEPFGLSSSKPTPEPFGLSSSKPTPEPFGLSSSKPTPEPFGLSSSKPTPHPLGLSSSKPTPHPFGLSSSKPGHDTDLRSAVQACIDAIAQLTRDGVDRAVLARVGECLSQLAARTDLFDFDRFPLAPDPAVPTAVYTLHVGSDGSLPLQLLSARPMPGGPLRAAHKPHQHPTWAAAACVRGATRERLWLRTGRGDELQPLPERTLTPGGGAFTMLLPDIHSVRGDDSGPAMHLLLYGQVFQRAVVFEPDTWHAHEYTVPAIAA